MKLREIIKGAIVMDDVSTFVQSSKMDTNTIHLCMHPKNKSSEKMMVLNMTRAESILLIQELAAALQVQPYTEEELRNKREHAAWRKERDHV